MVQIADDSGAGRPAGQPGSPAGYPGRPGGRAAGLVDAARVAAAVRAVRDARCASAVAGQQVAPPGELLAMHARERYTTDPETGQRFRITIYSGVRVHAAINLLNYRANRPAPRIH